MDIASTIVGALLGGAVSWFITDSYHKRASREQRRQIDKLSAELKRTNTIEYFSHLLTCDVWEKEWIDNEENWIARQNNTFRITKGQNYEDFDEPWSRGHPDRDTSKLSVYLSINGVRVKELIFVTIDGGRILVPLPERMLVDGSPVFFWRPNDLSFKVGKIIGSYYIYKDIEGVAKRCRVEVVNENSYSA